MRMSARSIVRARTQTWRHLVAPPSPTRFSALVAILVTAAFALVNAGIIIHALNLYHAVAVRVPLNRELALAHGRQIVALEQRLRLAVEPLVQQRLTQGVWTPLGLLPGAMIRRGLVWLYLNAMPAWLFAALAWSYLYRPLYFARLRDLTIISAMLAVACYWLFPAAPPRMVLAGGAGGLQDWAYGGATLDLGVMHVVGFNPFAAFPSVHFLWSLIPAVCLAGGSRRAWVWLMVLCYPLAMGITIIGTGNHYVLDCLGSVAILALSAALAWAIDRARQRVPRLRSRIRYEMPAALSLCLICSGILASADASGGLRHLLAVSIMLLIGLATLRSNYLWYRRRRVEPGRQPLWATDYLAGALFIAGATAAAHDPGQNASPMSGACALLWLLACLCALRRHIQVQRRAASTSTAVAASPPGFPPAVSRQL